MGLFELFSAQHKWNRLIIAFSSLTMISYFMLPFVYHLICVTSEAKCMRACVRVRVPGDSSLWFVVLVPGKCILNCVETLLHPQTGRSQITSQLLCGCGHTGREEYKMDGWENARVRRGGVFHPLISEAAGVLLSGLDGHLCDVNVWSTLRPHPILGRTVCL